MTATLEISNTTPLPAKIYANEGIAQVVFFGVDDICQISYADKKGKYQAQRAITLPKSLTSPHCRKGIFRCGIWRYNRI
jgi:dCTP deaminase